jgi:hypothetical protein
MRVQRDVNSQRTRSVFPRLKKIGRRKIPIYGQHSGFRSDISRKYFANPSLSTFPLPALYPIDGLNANSKIRGLKREAPPHPSGSFFN